MNPEAAFWRGRRILVTGHTGFKGSWLSLWLVELGAQVCGFSLPADTVPSLFDLSGLSRRMDSAMGDVRLPQAVHAACAAARPEIVFHLAAQPLVRRSYDEPVATFETNVMGTVNLLEAIRRCDSVRSVVIVTSDKCYQNDGASPHGEDDPLGGDDPYSSSKACAELVTAAWRRSFFRVPGAAAAVASARAGNVLGGGDWAHDRLVPDCIRAFASGRVLELRYPDAVRPWQHVLDPLSGYLLLARRLWDEPAATAEAWNFGPAHDDARPVSWIADRMAGLWKDGARWTVDGGAHPPEATVLRLDTSKARARLGWAPRLSLPLALEWTVEWYRRVAGGMDACEMTRRQIDAYQRLGPSSAA